MPTAVARYKDETGGGRGVTERRDALALCGSSDPNVRRVVPPRRCTLQGYALQLLIEGLSRSAGCASALFSYGKLLNCLS